VAGARQNRLSLERYELQRGPLIIGSLLKVIDGVAQAGGFGILGEGLFLNTSSDRPAPRKAQPGPLSRRYATTPTVQMVPFNFEKAAWASASSAPSERHRCSKLVSRSVFPCRRADMCRRGARASRA